MTAAGSRTTARGSVVSGPVVSGIENDGTRTLVYGEHVPTTEAKRFDFLNTLNAAQMKIRVKPDAVEGYVKESPSLSWQESFRIDRTADPVKPGGYIGFTARSGTTTSASAPG